MVFLYLFEIKIFFESNLISKMIQIQLLQKDIEPFENCP